MRPGRPAVRRAWCLARDATPTSEASTRRRPAPSRNRPPIDGYAATPPPVVAIAPESDSMPHFRVSCLRAYGAEGTGVTTRSAERLQQCMVPALPYIEWFSPIAINRLENTAAPTNAAPSPYSRCSWRAAHKFYAFRMPEDTSAHVFAGSDGSRSKQALYRNRKGTVCCRSIPELAVAVASPTLHVAILEKRACMTATHGNRLGIR